MKWIASRRGSAVADPGSERVGAFASLQHSGFRLLLIGRPFTTTGTWMRSTINAFQVYYLTGDARLLGLTFLFQGLPSLVTGFFGGTLADMLDRRRLLQAAALGHTTLSLALAALAATGRIEVWQIFVATALGAGIQSATQPAHQALIPRLVPQNHVMNAVAVNSTSQQAAMLLAPLLGGVLLDAAGAATAYLVAALVIVPAFVSITMLRLPAEGERAPVVLNVGALFEGLVFTVRSRILLAFVLLDTVTMVFGYYPAMMPVVAKDVLQVSATGLGALLAAPAIGATLGFLGIMLVGNVRSKGAIILLVTIGHAVALAMFAYSSWFVASLILAALLGFFDSMSVSVRTTCFQLLAPDHVRGRVMSVLSMAAQSSNSFGGAYLGLATSFLGVRNALALGSLIGGVFAAYVAVFRRRVWAFQA